MAGPGIVHAIWLIGALLLLYLTRLASAMSHTPDIVLNLSPKRWTRKEVLNAYERATAQPIDVKSFLPLRTGRRYVVVGGSGLVGGWIVEHLLLRGEDPSAIRVLDIRFKARPRIREHKVRFIRCDITDAASVNDAFANPWPARVARRPLTVFHTAAVIDSCNRTKDLFPALARVNIDGTRNVLRAARSAGAGVFISTSSGSVGVKAPKWFPPPWRYYPDHFAQIIPNAEPEKPAAATRHEEYYGNYAATKHLAETLVREADDKRSGFRTGCIRPGNAVYGSGVEDESSMTWRFLKTGSHPSWAHPCMQSFANAQNVSIAHLLFESKLLPRRDGGHDNNGDDLGGRAYCITDPDGPVTFRDVYFMLGTLARSRMAVPHIPALPMLCLAHLVEAYVALRRRHAPFLPAVAGKLLFCQPAVFNISTVNVVFDITLAREELGYRGPITTMEGIAADLVEWNRRLGVRASLG